MACIRTLRPNVSCAGALDCFRPPGMTGWLREQMGGPLRRVAAAYVPFLLYRVEVEISGRTGSRWFALDAFQGILDLYSFARIPDESEFVRTETRNALPVLLEESRAREIVVERVRQIVYRSGFFRLHNLKIATELVPLEFHVPYWLGFSAVGDAVQLAVLDAVRRRFEGAKARELFEIWLASNTLPPTSGRSPQALT